MSKTMVIDPGNPLWKVRDLTRVNILPLDPVCTGRLNERDPVVTQTTTWDLDHSIVRVRGVKGQTELPEDDGTSRRTLDIHSFLFTKGSSKLKSNTHRSQREGCESRQSLKSRKVLVGEVYVNTELPPKGTPRIFPESGSKNWKDGKIRTTSTTE